jgi:glycosyltransferase involved in cell wall biosynthesis
LRNGAVTELISLIVATYNREAALAAVLRAFGRQTDLHFELIIADDGSGPATKRVVDEASSAPSVPIKHVWHEDRGFRLAEIRNRAILQSSGAYCVFLDGDCIPPPGFVAAHRRLAERGWFVAGNRTLMSPALSARVESGQLMPEGWGTAAWIGARLRGEINRVAPLISLPLGAARKLQGKRWQSARGGNLAIWKDDLLRVDGFDAAFSGWGREDSDIIVRLIRAGVLRKDGRFATGVLHLWHPENDRARLADNERRLDAVLRGDRIRAERGLSTLSAPSADGVSAGLRTHHA